MRKKVKMMSHGALAVAPQNPSLFKPADLRQPPLQVVDYKDFVGASSPVTSPEIKGIKTQLAAETGALRYVQ